MSTKTLLWIAVGIGVVIYLRRRGFMATGVPVPVGTSGPGDPNEIGRVSRPGGTIQCFRAPCPGSLDYTSRGFHADTIAIAPANAGR